MQCDPQLRRELQTIYAELEQEIARAGPVCQLSGRCCRFEEFGHTLFVSNLETELLLEQGLPAGARVDPAGCPFQQDRLCTARERRPLGCRVFFCQADYQDRASSLSQKYLTRLKRLAERLARAWRYGPLHTMLAERTLAGPRGSDVHLARPR